MTPTPNQNPEQITSDLIDKQLEQAGWLVELNGNQDKVFYIQLNDLSLLIE